MNKHLVKLATGGTPLRRTDLPSVEQFLVDKISSDLGDYKKHVQIIPVLRVDEADNDLSGNVKNGFGNIMIQVKGVNLHVPFIIYEKHLLPFDVIRMNEDEVLYDASKLQRVVNAILLRSKESSGGEQVGKQNFDFGEVVDGKNISSSNGFLGTIMSIRDDESSRAGGSGAIIPFTGPEFGVLDDDRIDRYASVDIMNVFHDCMEKIAKIEVVPFSSVKSAVEELAKQAESESKERIEKVKDVDPTPAMREESAVQRHVSQLQSDKLVSVKRAASGNNIKFPVANEGMFEYRAGRVYHKIEPLAKSIRRGKTVPITSIILDNKNNYFFLKSREEFMMTSKEPKPFHFYTERARGLREKDMYAFEMNFDTLSYPFVVNFLHTEKYGPDTPRSFRFAKNIDENIMNSLFGEVYDCTEAFPSEETAKEFRSSEAKPFKIIVSTDLEIEPAYFDRMSILSYIETHAKTPTDAARAKELLMYGNDFYLVPPDFRFFKLERRIRGFFSKPDGYFTEGPLMKQAAYKNLNIVRLIVEKDNKPRQYAVEWTYGQEENVDAANTAVQLQQRKQTELTEDQAKQLLLRLGFDHRKTAILFEMTKRNGREARMPLPDLEKAKNVSPADIKNYSKKNILSNVFNATLNAGNFVPFMEDVMATGVVTSADHLMSKKSFDVAVEMEKKAMELNTPSWHELSALTHLKYQMDKLASTILDGDHLYDYEPVFKTASELKPFIAKYAKQLIDLNRRQIFSHQTPLMPVELVKEALSELDGLYKYASLLDGDFIKTANERINQQIMRISNDAIDMYGDYVRIKRNIASGQPVTPEEQETVDFFEGRTENKENNMGK